MRLLFCPFLLINISGIWLSLHRIPLIATNICHSKSLVSIVFGVAFHFTEIQH